MARNSFFYLTPNFWRYEFFHLYSKPIRIVRKFLIIILIVSRSLNLYQVKIKLYIKILITPKFFRKTDASFISRICIYFSAHMYTIKNEKSYGKPKGMDARWGWEIMRKSMPVIAREGMFYIRGKIFCMPRFFRMCVEIAVLLAFHWT